MLQGWYTCDADGGYRLVSTKKRTSVVLDETLLKKACRTLRTSNTAEAITKALEQTVANKEIEATLKDLIRKGRGRFVDVYR